MLKVDPVILLYLKICLFASDSKRLQIAAKKPRFFCPVFSSRRHIQVHFRHVGFLKILFPRSSHHGASRLFDCTQKCLPKWLSFLFPAHHIQFWHQHQTYTTSVQVMELLHVQYAAMYLKQKWTALCVTKQMPNTMTKLYRVFYRWGVSCRCYSLQQLEVKREIMKDKRRQKQK